MVIEKVPRTVEEVTPQWLTQALRSTGVIRTARVTVADRAGDVAIEGHTGPLARLRLSYDSHEQGAPRSLIAKLPASDPKVRIFLSDAGLYEREIRFYQEIADGAPIGTPRRYYSAMKPSTHEYILLMEDLAEADVGDHLAGCTLDEAELAVRSVASLHAHYWGCEMSQPLAWVPKFGEIGQDFQDVYQQRLPIFKERCQDRASAYLLDVGARFGPKLKEVFGLLSQEPVTIVHGDFRLDNMFFGTATGGRPFAVVDWQLIKRGRGVIDVAYFLAACMEEQDRRYVEQDLLKTYWSTLRQHGVEGYTLNQCLHDYRLSLLYPLLITVIALALLDFSTARSDALVTTILRRLAASLQDHDVAALLPP